MKKNILILCIVLTGCAAGSNFQPNTVEGAQCKSQCARSMANCMGSSYTCDRAASTCMDSCRELETLRAQQAK